MSLYEDNIGYWLDPARRDPANDPTLQPYLDMLGREAAQDHARSMYDLHDRQAGSGLLGTGYYQGMRVAANEQFDEALQGTKAQVIFGRLSEAEQNALNALGLESNRDIAKWGNETAIKTANIGASVGHEANALARAQWNANQPYTDLMNTINILNGINDLGGYTDMAGFVPNAAPYSGPSPFLNGAIGALGGGLQGWGTAKSLGYGNKPNWTPAS